MTTGPFTGGCQCGAVRFRVDTLGRPSLCHCRMCQKATGSFFGPFVTGHDIVWTRGEPKRFRSSNIASRGFCGECGTPLTYEHDGAIELTIGSFDDPRIAAPAIQTNPTDKLAFFDGLHELPVLPTSEATSDLYKSVVSNQHPDHDTDRWPPETSA